jgi:Bacterial PH domain
MSSDASDDLVYPYAAGRTAAFVATVFVAGLYVSLRSCQGLAQGFDVLDAFGAVLAASFFALGVMAVVRAVRGAPLVQASAAGITVINPWGQLFVRWADVADIEPVKFRWLRIRLRDGARPVGAGWTRMLSASLWVRNTVAVPLFTIASTPEAVAGALRQMQSRRAAG